MNTHELIQTTARMTAAVLHPGKEKDLDGESRHQRQFAESRPPLEHFTPMATYQRNCVSCETAFLETEIPA